MTRSKKADTGQDYPPIADYGYISDCHSAALVSRDASIDWCAMPRIDSASCFGRLLDCRRGGYCVFRPTGSFSVERRYLPNSLILEMVFTTDTGKARLVDCFTMRRGGRHQPHRQLLRIVEGIEGEVTFDFEFVPRFDYGAVKPWVRQVSDTLYTAIGGSDGLVLFGDLDFTQTERHACVATCTVHEGDRRRVSMIYRRPSELDTDIAPVPDMKELDRRLDETIQWWNDWTAQGSVDHIDGALTQRSAIVLKGLSNAPTGAIAAAATTSLPEAPGSSRNWDYRFTWIRDSVFTVRSLAELGYDAEADGFRRFVERSAAGSADEVQILFGVGGERRLYEHEVTELCGYRGASPVRIGNAAESQVQLDVYGELLDLAFNWHSRGNSPDETYWEFIVELVNKTVERWRDPDQGIWEMRGAPRHFVHSKAMCWTALDCGIRLAQDLDCEVPLDRWRHERDEIRRTIEKKGYDPIRGVFIQAFDYPHMDASLLLLPVFRFVPFDDERMIRTVDAIRQDLEQDGLLRRYADGNDELDGSEGTFLACTFWLVECLARQGRTGDARRIYDQAIQTRNDLDLFSEEYDIRTGEMLGNFPQGLTHLSQITAAVALAETESGTRKSVD